MFHTRPAAGYADLRTPVCGVYQAGSATREGGVTGIPARNVVRQILADRQAERWRRRAPPWPVPVQNASLLPGFLAIPRTGLSPAGDDELPIRS